MTDDLGERRYCKAVEKAQYQTGLSAIMDPVIASWQKIWADDCKAKGHTIPFGKWCRLPLYDDDPMSSPFEIANVYTEDTFKE